MNGDAPSRKLGKQLHNSRRSLAVARHDDRPFQVFSKLLRPNLPLSEHRHFLVANSNERPVPCQHERSLLIRQRSAKNKVVVPMHQDADHLVVSLQAHAEDCATRRRMVHRPVVTRRLPASAKFARRPNAQKTASSGAALLRPSRVRVLTFFLLCLCAWPPHCWRGQCLLPFLPPGIPHKKTSRPAPQRTGLHSRTNLLVPS